MSGPLSGIRVLDITRLLSGPFCTMLLADLGADVIKVERPEGGDPARILEPIVDGESAFFISVNRGKKSITLDISTQEGQRLFRDMATDFDVMVENFVPGTMMRFGLGYASLEKINPGMVYASISGFGQDGPLSDRPALDIIVQAMGGIMSITGQPDGPPIRPGPSLGDSTAGVFTALAVVSALLQRQSTGRGQYIDISMLDCQVTMMENAFSRYFGSGQVPGPLGSRHPSAAPFQAFQATDGYFVIGLLTNDEETWQRFCRAIGQMGMADDEQFQNNSERIKNIDRLSGILRQVFREESVDYWLERLIEAKIPCGPVSNTREVTENSQVKHRDMITEIPHHAGGTWQVANSPFKMSGGLTGPAGASPRLGEDTQEVLGSLLGLSLAEIDLLKNSGVI